MCLRVAVQLNKRKLVESPFKAQSNWKCSSCTMDKNKNNHKQSQNIKKLWLCVCLSLLLQHFPLFLCVYLCMSHNQCTTWNAILLFRCFFLVTKDLHWPLEVMTTLVNRCPCRWPQIESVEGWRVIKYTRQVWVNPLRGGTAAVLGYGEVCPVSVLYIPSVKQGYTPIVHYISEHHSDGTVYYRVILWKQSIIPGYTLVV